MQKVSPFFVILLLLLACSPKLKDSIQEGGLTGEDVIAMSIREMGGERKLKKVRTMKMVATKKVHIMDEAGKDYDVQIERYIKIPDKLLMKETSKFGTIITVLNGQNASIYYPNGKIMPITGVELHDIKETTLIFPELYMDDKLYSTENMGVDLIGYDSVQIVKVTYPDGNINYRHYDKTTKLLHHLSNDVYITGYFFGDYRTLNGIKLPYYYGASDYFNWSWDIRVEELEVNPALDDSLFDMK